MNLNKISLILVFGMILNGCAMDQKSSHNEVAMPTTNQVEVVENNTEETTEVIYTPEEVYEPIVRVDGKISLSSEREAIVAAKNVDIIGAERFPYYIQSLATKLIRNSRYVNRETPIGIASFVNLDDINTSSSFGRQIGENLMHEMQIRGLSVVDFKTTSGIKVKNDGDFIISRNMKELNRETEIEYLLVGTFYYANDGVIVNARIVGAETNVIVASAQTVIPNKVILKEPKINIETNNKQDK